MLLWITELFVAFQPAGFVGYDSQYEPILRQLISDKYYGSRCRVGVHEIFCNPLSPPRPHLSVCAEGNDGSKPDIGRLQLLFDPSMRVAVQDPAYPVRKGRGDGLVYDVVLGVCGLCGALWKGLW